MSPRSTAVAAPAARIPSLDGLRAVCILLVVIAHAHGTAGFPLATHPLPLAMLLHGLGEFGVRVFFVISGYLITSLLLLEESKTGTVSLRGFYVRRITRIFPAFYVFIAVVAVLAVTGVIALRRGDLLYAVTFLVNYHADRSWWVGHLWSLSVEEQFYLLWPSVLLLLGSRRALRVAGAILLLAPVVRVMVWRLWPGSLEGMPEYFPTTCDSIATGCVLSGARSWLDGSPRYLQALRSPAGALLLPLALVVSLGSRYPSVNLPLGYSLANVLTALTLDRVVRFPQTPDGRLLNTAPLRFIGVLSYSIYLWQQLFLDRYAISPLTAFPGNLGLVALASVLSYYGIEQTFLRLRTRRARSATPAGARSGSGRALSPGE
jgi:peptidoglycan/LPS O-acetylase OafA/YrhL